MGREGWREERVGVERGLEGGGRRSLDKRDVQDEGVVKIESEGIWERGYRM